MTRDEARTALAELAAAATAPTLTDAELDAALTASRLPDSQGRPPSDPDFVDENWDLMYAAAECYDLKAVKLLGAGQITKFTSEGSSFEKTGPDFSALADWYRDQSTVGDSGDGVVFVPIESKAPWWFRPRSVPPC
jgi:hypothetical protein